MTSLSLLATSIGLPLEQPVLVFAIATAVFLVGPLLAEQVGQPGIVTSSPRRGDVGWHSELEALPKRLAELPPESFITIHPRHGEPEYDRQYIRFE